MKGDLSLLINLKDSRNEKKRRRGDGRGDDERGVI